MNKIVNYTNTRTEIAEKKLNLIQGDIGFFICNEDYIATVESQGEEYIDFNEEIKNNYFRDCFLNANSTILFIAKTDIFEDLATLTYRFANIWYAVLSEYLPLERFGSKIRTLENKCVADFVSDVSANGNTTIGYINVGNTFNQPSYEKLINNRDKKDCCSITEEKFEEIMDKVFKYTDTLLKEV